ncbi:MAG: serine O-acetyltransferase [Polyangiales bacterium]
MSDQDPSKSLASLVGALVASYRADARGRHIDKHYLPSRDESISIVETLFQLIYPGYFGTRDLPSDALEYHVGVLLSSLREKLDRQIELCLCYRNEIAEPGDPNVPSCRDDSRALVEAFLARLPGLRAELVEDVGAAFDGDPAAFNHDEVILAYPGLFAITVYRIAHELHRLGVPLMPRIMTEWAHTMTGADIHPGAQIGHRFFIDHATGVVIGETTVIGDDVRLYQGVTLGAASIPRDSRGRVVRGTKRHPTVEDGVTIYANATVLGGHTVIGSKSVLGGSVFVTTSVPPGSRVALKPPELRMHGPKEPGSDTSDDFVLDFEI